MNRTAPEASRRLSQQEALEQMEQLFRLDSEDAGELILARHARPASGPDGEPAPDPMLSCEGLEQAERLAARLDGLWIEAVYTAPERRAFQTAKVVADCIQRPLRTLDALAEIEFDPAAAATDYAMRFAAQLRWACAPGFGDGKAFRRRAVLAIDGILAAHPRRRAVVVTHASLINAYLSMLLGVPRDVFFAPDHASLCVVRHEADVWALRSLNDTAHLAPCDLLDGAPRALTARSLPLTNR